ncbi:MAG: 6-phosphogluconolactonase [Pseudomonadota bacterium]
MTPTPPILEFETRELASAAAMSELASALKTGLTDKGAASLLVSGGSSPKRAHQLLSHTDLDWASVTVGLVDERWVDPGEDGSNETFVRDSLLQNHASMGHFIGMKTLHASPFEAVEHVAAAYREIPAPYDAVFLGMGPDGHVASWHPHTQGLELALDPSNQSPVTATRATPSNVTGPYLDRMTLTLPPIASARRVVLLIMGQAKRDTLDQAMRSPVADMPVRAAVEATHDTLKIIWAP